MKFSGSMFNIINEFPVISHNGINFCQTRNKDQTVLIVPADLIMCIVSRITSGRVVHDCHSAQLVQCGTNTGYICRINWYDSIRLSHRQHSHPHPFCTTSFSVSFSSRYASIINSAVLRIPSNPYRPSPCTRLTK